MGACPAVLLVFIAAARPIRLHARRLFRPRRPLTSSAPNIAAGLTSPNHTGSPCGNPAQTKNARSRSVLSRSPPICAACRWRSTTKSAAPSSDCRLCRPSWLETRSCHWCRLQSSRWVDHPSWATKSGSNRQPRSRGSLV